MVVEAYLIATGEVTLAHLIALRTRLRGEEGIGFRNRWTAF